ncbi:hypothetical protein [Streptomyces sp. HUAS TT7]|uniref:hypothetical protein n=1 Tax=Streptomyces sp. HUAS TT7 TaxID=3447507 RepID=UPI003F65DE98
MRRLGWGPLEKDLLSRHLADGPPVPWGSGGHDRVGPGLPAGSRICAEFNYGATTRPCITLR